MPKDVFMIKTARKRTDKKQDGFTLVEVVVASTILMGVFAGLIGAITFARRMQSIAENRLVFTHMAREYMEPFCDYMYDDDVFETGSYKIYDDHGNSQNQRGTCVISKVNGESTKDVEVTINWVEPSSDKVHSITLHSSFSRSLHR